MTTASIKNDDDPSSLQLSSLSDEVLLYILSFSDAEDLCSIESSSKFFQNSLDTSFVWKNLCDQTFSTFPRYACQKYGYPLDSFKETYHYLFKAVRRTQIEDSDLTSLRWYFNYHPIAGGRGKETLVECEFTGIFLNLNGYPPLPYTLRGSILQVSNFPQHTVSRLPDGEWLIHNDMVTFVSCDSEGTLNYRGRGFQQSCE